MGPAPAAGRLCGARPAGVRRLDLLELLPCRHAADRRARGRRHAVARTAGACRSSQVCDHRHRGLAPGPATAVERQGGSDVCPGRDSAARRSAAAPESDSRAGPVFCPPGRPASARRAAGADFGCWPGQPFRRPGLRAALGSGRSGPIRPRLAGIQRLAVVPDPRRHRRRLRDQGPRGRPDVGSGRTAGGGWVSADRAQHRSPRLRLGLPETRGDCRGLTEPAAARSRTGRADVFGRDLPGRPPGFDAPPAGRGRASAGQQRRHAVRTRV